MKIERRNGGHRHEWYLLVLFVLTLPLLNPWVRGDGVGYYAYARAPLIEHSLDFTHDYQNANDSFREGRLDAQGMPLPRFRTRTGHLDNHFTVGPAILWSPFLVTAHAGVLLARALGSGVAADGFSAPYRYAMALGTGVYGFLALLFSYWLARKYLGSRWAFLATLAIWWASSLPVYTYFNPSWSHVHSAFTVALFLWYWDKTRTERTLPQWIALGLIAGLMLNVYYANLMILGVLVAEAIQQYWGALRSDEAGKSSAPQRFVDHVIFCGVVAAALLPTFISRWIVYGGPFETGYLSLRDFLWSSPVPLKVLFSADHGLLAWTPLLAFSFAGLVIFARRVPVVGVAFLSATLAFYAFFAFYPDWDGISSYGNRFFVSLTPLFIFGLAQLLEWTASFFRKPLIAVATLAGVLACFVLWNLGLIYQWGTHLIPPRGPISFQQAAYNQFAVVPRQLSSHLRAYFLRRSDLMHQIEQEDRKELKKNSEP